MELTTFQEIQEKSRYSVKKSSPTSFSFSFTAESSSFSLKKSSSFAVTEQFSSSPVATIDPSEASDSSLSLISLSSAPLVSFSSHTYSSVPSIAASSSSVISTVSTFDLFFVPETRKDCITKLEWKPSPDPFNFGNFQSMDLSKSIIPMLFEKPLSKISDTDKENRKDEEGGAQIRFLKDCKRFGDCDLQRNMSLRRKGNDVILPKVRVQNFPDCIPDSKIYKVEAILKPWRVPRVSLALLKMEIRGSIVFDVQGFGAYIVGDKPTEYYADGCLAIADSGTTLLAGPIIVITMINHAIGASGGFHGIFYSMTERTFVSWNFIGFVMCASYVQFLFDEMLIRNVQKPFDVMSEGASAFDRSPFATEIRLIPVKEYMKLTYQLVVGNLKDIAQAYCDSFCPRDGDQDNEEKVPDFVETMVYSPTQVYYAPGPVLRGEVFDGAEAMRQMENRLIENHGYQPQYGVSFVYVPCEVIKQRMQVQGSVAMKDGIVIQPDTQIYGYYTGMFHAGYSILKTQGLNGLYVGYFSTLAMDAPFAGLMVLFYEALKDVTEYGNNKMDISLGVACFSSLAESGALCLYDDNGVKSLLWSLNWILMLIGLLGFVGLGNQYVTAAKMILQNSEVMVSINMLASPYEVLVTTDKHAIPSHVAADLLSQAEHGIDIEVVLVIAGDGVATYGFKFYEDPFSFVAILFWFQVDIG